MRFTTTMMEVGRWALPDFLPWDPAVHEDSPVSDLIGDGWAWLPWKLRLPDGTGVKVVYDFLRDEGESPYEVRAEGGRFVLDADGEPLCAVTFDQRPGWIVRRTRDGATMGKVMSWLSPVCLQAFPIRYCAYASRGDVCAFCCLNPMDRDLAGATRDGLLMRPAHAAEVYDAAVGEGGVRHVCLTGGGLYNQRAEAEHFARVIEAIATVRDARGRRDPLKAMTTAMGAEEQRRLKIAGADEISFNMEVWAERLWPVVVPGKAKVVGRARWMERLAAAVEVFGRGRVLSQFVLGVETVAPEGFRDPEAALASVTEGFEWCARHGVVPRTHVWMNTPGSAYERSTAPPTEYLLAAALARHRAVAAAGLYRDIEAYPQGSASCPECSYVDTDADFHRLLGAA